MTAQRATSMGALPHADVADDALGANVCAFVNTLAHCGVRHVCACPGSRSAPLLLTLHAQRRIKLWMHLDERSAGYFALGLAKTLGEPVGLLATSGTAAANFFPAVVEAFYARVPLVVLTADRPHELRDCGAPQTIDQLHLYGRHAKWFVDLPEPEGSPALIAHVRATAARAVAVATEAPAGPVHVNWPFREPLVPGRVEHKELDHQIRIADGKRTAPPALLDQLATELAQTERGLIVCGPQDDPALAPALTRLSAKLGFPLLADPLSGARFGAHDRTLVLDAYDAFLRLPWLAERLKPEVVLRIGALPTSKPVLQYLQRHPDARHVVLDSAGWRDPTGVAGDIIHADPTLTCAALADRLPSRGQSSWTAEWLRTQRATRAAITAALDDDFTDELFEGKVFAELARALPDPLTLYVGNSMPVRDLDTFTPSASSDWRVLSNRGTNGIDGVVSSALGASAAGHAPTVLVIGDLSFYHDLNGLLAARQHRIDLLVVVVNNDGGGIFSFLPQAGVEGFERLFGTPHGLDFRAFVEGYGGTFARVDSWTEFSAAVADSLGRRGLRVIEVPTERERNVVLHRAVWQRVESAVHDVLAAAVV